MPPSLEPIVGKEVYAIWLRMLKTLVPNGRTHRLAPLVAGMIKFAAEAAYRRYRGHPPHGSLAEALIFCEEMEQEAREEDSSEDEEDSPENGRSKGGILFAAVDKLFRDAHVRGDRVNSRGDKYSVVDSVVQDFIRWDAMPCE